MPTMDLRTAIARLDAPDVLSRMRACERLGELGQAEAVASLLARLEEAEDNAVRILAAVALGKIGDPRALSALELTPATNNTHEMYGEVSSTFAKAASRLRPRLGSADRRADIRRLIRGMRQGDDNVSARCAQGIVDWGGDALDALAGFERWRNPRARVRAVEAMGRIARKEGGRGRAVGLLLAQVGAADPGVQVHALLGLRHQRDGRVAARLLPLLRHPEPRVRLQAMLTLESVDAFEAMAELERMAAEDHAVLGPQTRLDDSAASVLRTMRRKLAARRAAGEPEL